MKRKEFILKLKQEGCIFLRSGSRHDIYLNPLTGKKQPVPRHMEAKHIIKQFGIK